MASPSLKLMLSSSPPSSSSRDHNFIGFKDEKSLLKFPKVVDFKPISFSVSSSSSSSPRCLRPLSLSSPSQTQEAEVANHQLLIGESSNGYATFEAETQTVGVQFQLQRECSFGQNFLLTGDHPILGLWDPNNAISLTWSEGHLWSVHLDIPVGKCIKFKFIMQESDGRFMWQPGPDRVLECFHTEKIITLCEDWENPDSRVIIESDPIVNHESQFVEPSVCTADTQEPEGYAVTMSEVLVSDEVVPVLVPGSCQSPVDEGPDDEPEPLDEASMVSARANDLTLPELDSKGDIANTSNSNSGPKISTIPHENQETCENNHDQEVQVAEEEDEATEPMTSLLHNDIHWSNNVMQKLLNILGIQY